MFKLKHFNFLRYYISTMRKQLLNKQDCYAHLQSLQIQYKVHDH